MPRINQLSKDTELKLTDNVVVNDSSGTKVATINQIRGLVSKASAASDNYVTIIIDGQERLFPLNIVNVETYSFEPQSQRANDKIYATNASTVAVGTNVSSLIFAEEAVEADAYISIYLSDGTTHFSQISSVSETDRTITLSSEFSDFNSFDSDATVTEVFFLKGDVQINGEDYVSPVPSYDTGTFTPQVYGLNAGLETNTTRGEYTRIGNIVHIYGVIGIPLTLDTSPVVLEDSAFPYAPAEYTGGPSYSGNWYNVATGSESPGDLHGTVSQVYSDRPVFMKADGPVTYLEAIESRLWFNITYKTNE